MKLRPAVLSWLARLLVALNVTGQSSEVTPCW